MTFRDRQKIIVGKEKTVSQDEMRRFNLLIARGISDPKPRPDKPEPSESSQQNKPDSKASREPEDSKKEKKPQPAGSTASSRRPATGLADKREDRRGAPGPILTESRRLEEAEKPMRSRINHLIKFNH